jgi:hypothetical protein
VHVIAGYEGTFPFDDPGDLGFIVAVQVLVKEGLYVFLYDYRMLSRYWDRELNYLHFTNIIKIFLKPKAIKQNW